MTVVGTVKSVDTSAVDGGVQYLELVPGKYLALIGEATKTIKHTEKGKFKQREIGTTAKEEPRPPD